MRILDSNLWVFAFTGTNRRAAGFVEDAVSQETKIVLDAYIVHEVLEAFERSSQLPGTEANEAMGMKSSARVTLYHSGFHESRTLRVRPSP